MRPFDPEPGHNSSPIACGDAGTGRFWLRPMCAALDVTGDYMTDARRIRSAVMRSRSPATIVPAGLTRVLRVAISLLALLLLLPFVLTPLDRVGRPVSTLMLWRWLTGAHVERIWTPIDRIAPILPQSVIVAEDTRFCTHHGVDFREMREMIGAIGDLEDIDDLRGGSTITQQTVKNLFLWPGRSYVRKALEFPLALWFDLVVPKRRIMEIYLNIAEWGPN